MKVINGGIPGKPQDSVEIGHVYSQLALIMAKRAEQLRQTDEKVNKVVDRISAQRDRDYGNLERQLEDHINTKGLKHGENLSTLGLQMVNDFPFGSSENILTGDGWKTYLDPQALTDALQQWQYDEDPRVLARGNDFYTKNNLHLDTLFDARGIKDTDFVDEWKDFTPVVYHGGVIGPVNVKSGITYLPTLPYIQNHSVVEGVSLGVTDSDITAYGWGSKTLKRESTNEYFLLDDYHQHQPLSFTAPGTAGSLAKELAWLEINNDLQTGYGATCYAYDQGIALGLRKVVFGNKLSFDDTFTFTVNGRVMNDQIVTVPWDEYFPGKAVTVLHEGKVYGGLEHDEDLNQLTMFLLVHLNVDGITNLYVFRWEGNYSANACTLTLHPYKDDLLDVLPDNHAFHPVYGRGVIKSTGGHISGRHYGHRTYFLEHSYPHTSFRDLLDSREELLAGSILTEQRLVTNRHYSPLGNSLGRMLLTNDHTVINGQVHADGDWSHYLCHYDGKVGVGGNNFRFNHPVLIFPMAERTMLSREYVNTIQSNGKVGLAGTVWSNENDYQGVLDARGKVGGDIYGKPGYIVPEDLETFKAEHQEWLDFRGGLGYTALVVMQDGEQLHGLEIRADHLRYLDVAYLDVKLTVNGEYHLTRVGDRSVLNESEPAFKHVSNNRRWLMTDFYVHFHNEECHVVIQNPFKHVPGIFEFRLNNGNIGSVIKYVPQPDKAGLIDFAPVVMTLSGPCIPKRVEPGKGEYSNYYGVSVDRYAGEFNTTGLLAIEPGTRMEVNGDPFDIPPGLVARYTPNTKQYIYLTLTNGVVSVLVSGVPVERGQLYAIVETNGTVDLKIT
ncbi:hypothetical protein [Vibrio phage pTD1]|uniref:Uncharacterized protein n=1 Tax=Vibrio phage pTD1 TaxID=1938577 RepID=A0A1Q2U2R5_9CAUD|nr:hypothetical protein FDH33_gp044 [Vibrio phage pTD1]BAW98253.1 hypothetical protein [Vibrio phage pTD1]